MRFSKFLVLGLIGAAQMEVTTATIAVLLTIIGYSMNDKIVVFDRIRENLRLKQNMNLYDLVDLAITETLSRTIVSSLTVVLSMLAGYVFTQGSIQDFALALIVGVVVGAGIFKTPADVAAKVGHEGLVMLVWLLGGGDSASARVCVNIGTSPGGEPSCALTPAPCP